VTAFMSTIVKIAAFGAFFRMFATCFGSVQAQWVTTLQVLTILTLLISNITAVFQNSAKRMLAYSSISHAGYLLIALVALNADSPGAILYYVAAYAMSTLTAFAVLHNVAGTNESAPIDVFNGLAKRYPFLAFIMTVSLLSLAGIPPLAGFFAKYYMFTVAFENGYVSLVLVAVFTSLIGIYYYFKIIIAMYLKSDEATPVLTIPVLHWIVMVAGALITIALGIFPGLVAGLI